MGEESLGSLDMMELNPMSANEDAAGEYAERMQRAIAAELRAEMNFRGLKQGEVAARTGIPTNTLGRYLNGRRPMKVEEMAKITYAIGIEHGLLQARVDQRLKDAGNENGTAPE